MQTDRDEDYKHRDDSLLDNADISGGTPRAPQMRSVRNENLEFAEYPSSYEALKRELKGAPTMHEVEDNTQTTPSTPGLAQRLPDMSMTPMSSPFEPTSYLPSATQRQAGADPLLHRVLDKNYRLQATPHTARKEKTANIKPSWQTAASPDSSPLAAPQLRSNIFDSPKRQQYNALRIPGVSVQTPAKKGKSSTPAPRKDEISWESDSDEDVNDIYKELGMSPPKTIQFAIQPSKLLQTPGKMTPLSS